MYYQVLTTSSIARVFEKFSNTYCQVLTFIGVILVILDETLTQINMFLDVH